MNFNTSQLKITSVGNANNVLKSGNLYTVENINLVTTEKSNQIRVAALGKGKYVYYNK